MAWQETKTGFTQSPKSQKALPLPHKRPVFPQDLQGASCATCIPHGRSTWGAPCFLHSQHPAFEDLHDDLRQPHFTKATNSLVFPHTSLDNGIENKCVLIPASGMRARRTGKATAGTVSHTSSACRRSVSCVRRPRLHDLQARCCRSAMKA